MNEDIKNYHSTLSLNDKAIADALHAIINAKLKKCENKVWHAHPVWFMDGNPLVGYSKLKDCMRLLFWSGQSFEEENLKPEGKFKAAEIRYTHFDQIKKAELNRWLKKAMEIQWDYKNIVKRKGKLIRLK
jgi:hypothetical protein